MTITYSFKITSVNRLILYIDEEDNRYENLITKINYYYQGVDDEGNKAIFNSSVNLPKPTTTEYKKYNELTEDDIMIWLESLVSETEINLMKSVIENNIIEITTKADNLPWQI